VPKILYYPKVLDNVTIPAASAVVDTKSIPTHGARCIIFVIVAAGVAAFGACQWLGRTTNGAGGWFSPTGTGLTDGLTGKTLALNNGAAVIIAPTTATGAQYLIWPFMNLRVVGNAGASPANDIPNCSVDAFVLYDGDRDKLDMRQENAVAV
jgi:hypothetical protein